MLISVLIPAYNHAQFIGKAIESVLASQNHQTEILVLDDGSRDATEQVVRQYPQALYLRQDNVGAPQALNRLANSARGDFLAILNDDDLYQPLHLSNSVRLLLSTNSAIVATVPSVVGEPHRAAKMENFITRARSLISQQGPLTALTQMNWAVSTSSFVMHKDAFHKIGGFRDFQLAHDMDFLLRAYLIGLRVCYNPWPTWHYRCHNSNSISLASESEHQHEINQIRSEYYKALASQG